MHGVVLDPGRGHLGHHAVRGIRRGTKGRMSGETIHCILDSLLQLNFIFNIGSFFTLLKSVGVTEP